MAGGLEDSGSRRTSSPLRASPCASPRRCSSGSRMRTSCSSSGSAPRSSSSARCSTSSTARSHGDRQGHAVRGVHRLDHRPDRRGGRARAIGLVFMRDGKEWALAVAFAAMAGSFLVSYTRARAEALGLRGDVGLSSRAERVVIISAGLILAPWGFLPWAISILAASAWITVVQRALSVRGAAPTAQAEDLRSRSATCAYFVEGRRREARAWRGRRARRDGRCAARRPGPTSRFHPPRARRPLADAAQLVHYDMRGHGRSDDAGRRSAGRWRPRADDVVGLCDRARDRAAGRGRQVVRRVRRGPPTPRCHLMTTPCRWCWCRGRGAASPGPVHRRVRSARRPRWRLRRPAPSLLGRTDRGGHGPLRPDLPVQASLSARPYEPKPGRRSSTELRRAFVSGDGAHDGSPVCTRRRARPRARDRGRRRPHHDDRRSARGGRVTCLRISLAFDRSKAHASYLYTDAPGRALELIREFLLDEL